MMVVPDNFDPAPGLMQGFMNAIENPGPGRLVKDICLLPLIR
jgi:hypothetical protein